MRRVVPKLLIGGVSFEKGIASRRRRLRFSHSRLEVTTCILALSHSAQRFDYGTLSRGESVATSAGSAMPSGRNLVADFRFRNGSMSF
jgi:hypothetical protein